MAALTAQQLAQLEEQEAGRGGVLQRRVRGRRRERRPAAPGAVLRRVRPPVPVIRLHDTRHAANSLMAAAGVPDHIRAAWCGHAVAVNVSTYTHARDEDLRQAADALTGILGASDPK